MTSPPEQHRAVSGGLTGPFGSSARGDAASSPSEPDWMRNVAFSLSLIAIRSFEGLKQGSILIPRGDWGSCARNTGLKQEWKQGWAFSPQHTRFRILAAIFLMDSVTLQLGASSLVTVY